MKETLFRVWLCGMLAFLLIGLPNCTPLQRLSSELTPHATPLYTIGVPKGWHVRTFDETFPLVTFVSVKPIPDDLLLEYTGFLGHWDGPAFAIMHPIEPLPALNIVETLWSGDGVITPREDLLEEQVSLIDGSPVRQIIYQREQEGRQDIGWRALVTSECLVKAAFFLDAVAPVGRWDEFWPLFQAMRDSFKTHGRWPEPPVAMITYEGETFRINYYQNWETQVEGIHVNFGDALPLYDNFSVTVSRPLETIPEDLGELMHRDGTFVLEGPVKIAGREGYELAERREGECPYIEWEAVVVGGSPPRSYHFYAGASADAWEHAWPLIQEMRNSFEIIDED